MARKSSREKRVLASALFATPITYKQRRELEHLASKPDSEIEYSDAPEILPLPSEVQIGRLFRAIRRP